MAFRLVTNMGDPASETRPEKLRFAVYASKAEAVAQAKHDLSLGFRVLRVEDGKGKTVWKPRGNG